jgi:hypothetical protein
MGWRASRVSRRPRSRAMLLFERQAGGSWLLTTVILAAPKRLQGKCLPGNPDRDARLAMLLRDARPPRINAQTEERGTFLDWVDRALRALANGHTTWTAKVVPTANVDALYEREVARGKAGLPEAPNRHHPSRTPDARPCLTTKDPRPAACPRLTGPLR